MKTVFRLRWKQSNIKFSHPYFLEILAISFFLKHKVLVGKKCYKTEERHSVYIQLEPIIYPADAKPRLIHYPPANHHTTQAHTPGSDGFSSQAWALMKKGKFLSWIIKCTLPKDTGRNTGGKKTPRFFRNLPSFIKSIFVSLCSLLCCRYGIGTIFLGTSGNPERISKGKDLQLGFLVQLFNCVLSALKKGTCNFYGHWL